MGAGQVKFFLFLFIFFIIIKLYSPTKKGAAESVLARLKWCSTKGFHPFYRVRGHKTFYPVRGRGGGMR